MVVIYPHVHLLIAIQFEREGFLIQIEDAAGGDALEQQQAFVHQVCLSDHRFEYLTCFRVPGQEDAVLGGAQLVLEALNFLLGQQANLVDL